MGEREACLVPKRGQVLKRVMSVVFFSCLCFPSRKNTQSCLRSSPSSSYVTPSLETIKP
ncbi:hypothetical protein AXX17_AT1G15270 [Arabidopsis thaliana]|uniref:Uncharacterized protein n=1 Tax=Arabidopsis thaliana TaxID=3702 RepID=A0A178WGB2_ARATH|nr:hypothetical protein AXX17_AT1G15270 [Arabidopsis thaliana]